MENFRPGTMERLGLGYETLKSRNASLIYCSITGFGSTGPDAQRPGYDLILQGESGVMDITGEPEGQPTKVGTSIGDMVAGLFAAQGILAALFKRKETGEGHSIHVSMLDALASLLTFNAGIYYAMGASPSRRGNEHPTICPYETFKVSDGWINLGVANDKFWHLFCRAARAQHLEYGKRFACAPDRVANRAELKPIIADILLGKSRGYWIKTLGNAGIPCGEIKTVAEVCATAQLMSRGIVITMDHPRAGIVRNIDSPVRVDDENAADDVAPPVLGQHTWQVLRDVMGLPVSQIEALAGARVIRGDR